MYLPIHLNTPLLAGGLIAHFVGKSTPDKKLGTARTERGTLIASGFIAGGAIMGVFAAFINYLGGIISKQDKWSIMQAIGTDKWSESDWAAILSFGMYALLLVYLYWDSKRAKIEE
jgi:hypothetical protein